MSIDNPISYYPTVVQGLMGIGQSDLKKTCPEGFAYIPAGTFKMGSERGEPDERPVRTIFTDAYCISKTETTNAQFRTAIGPQYEPIVEACKVFAGSILFHSINMFTDAPSDGGDSFNGPNQPAINVNWKNADEHCEKIGGRLPTEAEWEKAARGPRGLQYAFDGELTMKKANYHYAGGSTTDVCSYPANDYGLCDMTGNVLEWTSDWYAEGAYELMKPQNPQGPESGGKKVVRGGSWDYFTGIFRATERDSRAPRGGYNYVGFRCVVDPLK